MIDQPGADDFVDIFDWIRYLASAFFGSIFFFILIYHEMSTLGYMALFWGFLLLLELAARLKIDCMGMAALRGVAKCFS